LDARQELDGSAPIGPWLSPPIAGRHGAQAREDGRERPSLRAFAHPTDSKYITLKPGDIIFTGTPEGVIAGHPKDKQVWLKHGDKLVTSVEKPRDLSFTLT
jgi:hypothetical protein